ncbi:hypothetical protein ACIBCO_36170 [Streptomyces violascens]|uniref:hypothetical protein n=1 Tax=Streptomyces violascens TaxID=67381 RepID=UPI0037A2C535
MTAIGPYDRGGPRKAMFQWHVFHEEERARADLQGCLDDTITAAASENDTWFAEQYSMGAEGLRNSGAGQLILAFGLQLSHLYALYEVLPGESSPQAGTAFYNGWVDAMQAQPSTAEAITFADGPTLMKMNWR